MTELPDSVTKGKLADDRDKGIPPLIEELNTVKRHETIARNKFYGSDIGYCPRKSVAFRLVPDTYEVPISTSSEFYFSVGNAINDTVVELLGDMVVEAEAYVSHSVIEVGGRIDAIVEEPDGKPTFVEIKSCGRLPQKPRKNHEYQVGVYGYLAGCDRMKLLYVSRNVADWTGKLQAAEFIIPPEQVRKSARNMAISHIFWEHKIIPPIPSHIKKSDCRFCALIGYCWEGKDWTTFDLKLPSDEEVAPVMKEAKTYFHTLMEEWTPRSLPEMPKAK